LPNQIAFRWLLYGIIDVHNIAFESKPVSLSRKEQCNSFISLSVFARPHLLFLFEILITSLAYCGAKKYFIKSNKQANKV